MPQSEVNKLVCCCLF